MTRNRPADQTGGVWLGPEVCRDVEAAAAREWWLADGVGGYAGGTVSGALTRRYHGLLVAPLVPPLGRRLLVARADATLVTAVGETPLATNHWGGGAVDPRGHEHLESFHLDHGLPVWRYAVGDQVIEQRLWLTHGAHQARLAFRRVAGDGPAHLRLALMASHRDHHHVSHPGGFQLELEAEGPRLRLGLGDGHTVDIRASHGRFTADATWMENYFLAREHERGLEAIDAHLRVGWLELPLTEDWCGLVMTLDGAAEPQLAASLEAERRRRAALQDTALPGVEPTDVPPWVRTLVTAADAYLFRRADPAGPPRTSVIAGYPWFGDWGRDTMIALPGLALATGRPGVARDILETFAGYVSEGMLPNVFPGAGGEPEYNTVDAALWYVEAWRAYFEATADRRALETVFPVLLDIIHAHRQGSRYGIGVDPDDGLLRAGEPGWQLTWMDARVDGREVTPRHGKPVEVNALWFNALAAMATLARVLRRDGAELTTMAAAARQGFARFHRGAGAGLFDVIDGPQGDDASIRPNQLLAVSLPFSPLPAALQRAVVAECRAHLLTPCGLRSLAPADPRYQGRYEGGVWQRDGAYHQGPVWGWLLGHYALAEYRVSRDAATTRCRLAAIAGHLAEAGLGHVSEIFDGDPPHAPRGAPAQAWSVACTLEAWWRLARAEVAGRSAG